MLLKIAANQFLQGPGSMPVSILQPTVTEQSASQKTALSSNLHPDHTITFEAGSVSAARVHVGFSLQYSKLSKERGASYESGKQGQEVATRKSGH